MSAMSRPGAVTGTTSTREGADWQDRAACRQYDADLWHAAGSDLGAVADKAEAKRICRTRCPVLDQCLRYALDNEERWGIWGGLDEDERRAITRGKPLGGCGGPGGRKFHRAQGTRVCRACLTYEANKQKAAALKNWANIQPLLDTGLTLEQAATELGLSYYTAKRARQAAARAGQATPDVDALVLEVRHLISVGADIHEAARVTQRTPEALERALQRREQHDLLARLKRAA